MRAESEALLILQDRDQKIKALRNQQKFLPRDKKALEDKLQAARAGLDQAKLLVKNVEVERRKLELDVESKRAAIARFKTQQQATRKNEEYQAFNHEIAHFEADIRALEDRELILMEEAEGLQAKATATEKEFVRFQASIQDQIAKLESGAASSVARLQELEANREQLAAKVSEETLTLYDRLFSKKGDAAVVPLEHEVCGGCHMKVPTQTAITVRGEQATTQCPNCGRILYRVV
jgi:predicted  nucleic acid-binding Zn-ribbon protein